MKEMTKFCDKLKEELGIRIKIASVFHEKPDIRFV